MGSTVNQGAVNQEQQNQVQGQQYAAQQQQQALAGINNWTAANKPPGQTAAPLQMPGASSPATMGGGNIQAGQPQMAGRRSQAMPGQPGQQPAQNPVALNPAQKAHIMALIGGQGAPMRAPGQ
jgi:hypothetical protein